VGVEVFVEALRVVIAAAEGVCAIESAGPWAVPASAEVILLQVPVIPLAGVRRGYSFLKEHGLRAELKSAHPHQES